MKIAMFSGALIEYSIHEALQIAQRIGVDGLEIAGNEPHFSPTTSSLRIKEIKRLADNLGLAIPAIGGYAGRFSELGDADCEREFENIRRMLPKAAELGASLFRVQTGGPNGFLAQEYHYQKSAHFIDRCAEEAQQYNIRIALEIHNQSIIETTDDCSRLLKLIKRDNVGFIHDAGNMYITDTDYGRDSVLRLGSRLFHVHVKDELRIPEAGDPGTFTNLTRHGQEAFVQCRLGDGGVDHQPLFAALEETGYDGWVTLECFAPYPIEERFRHDFKEVRSLLASKS
ncbi:sugar phosphate isomerase/epimerase family protein [Paenibacillus nasutitermitis]|uniref:Xylose isomerase-like TIM barrel domain-containing protein n=1 Tax=Paenibacillus nasutitermitis TaxID=1652958 RepID=A0A916YQB2_9BACL|nr:sugar phosphate isomerase/epimerase [Paenibacillus nasutitermitis]GGD56741.1 hypothetical protein GCM10010911_13090 [Paenibacillus nasutitermitis]